jgi:hypothetical protein
MIMPLVGKKSRTKPKPLRPQSWTNKILRLFERVPRKAALARQLDTAISLWLSEKDALAVHLIVMAAYRCLCDLHGKKVEESTKVYDWLRHSSKDRDDRIDFSEGDNPRLLMSAIMLFERIYGRSTPSMRAFEAWFFIRLLPSHFEARKYASEVLPQKGVSLADVVHLRRGEFFRKLSKRFLAEDGDKAPLTDFINEPLGEPRLAPDFL